MGVVCTWGADIVKLEEAINRAEEVLRKAGYPSVFCQLESTAAYGEGGWKLTYRVPFTSKTIYITFDTNGDLISFQTGDGT